MKKNYFLYFFIAAILLYYSKWTEGNKNRETNTIENFQGTYTCRPGTIYHPTSTEEIQKIVLSALEEKKTIMAGNQKYATQIDGSCANDGQIQLTFEKMNKLIDFDPEKKSITVQPGFRFNKLNDFIRSHSLAINMVTELDTFTVAGMLGNGTHGSTLYKHCMLADYVTELKIVDGMGNVRVLKGEELDAARVNLGVLGIVVEITIQLEPAYKVLATVQGFESDQELESKIIAIARNNYSASVAWFPGLQKYTLTTYEILSIETPGNAYNAQAVLNKKEMLFYQTLYSTMQEVPGTWLQCFAAELRFKSRASSYFRDIDSGEIISNPIGYSDQMQYFSCTNEEECFWDVMPIALQEVAIPLTQLPEWIRDTKNILLSNPHNCFPLNGIYFRFGKASNSYLGMNAGRETAFIGIEFTLRQRGKKIQKNYFINSEIEQMSLKKYGARPHWGKNSIATFQNIPSRYPKWNDFIAFKKKLDPKNIFTNTYWDRISKKIPSSSYLSPGCSSRLECNCQTDEHCEEGSKCVPGAYFKEAKVCR